MRRISLRTQLIAFGAVAIDFLAAFLVLRPPEGTLSDAEYIARARATPQGQLYFKTHTAPCTVTRVFTIQVNCDFVARAGSPTEKFRVYF
ncbi:MAG TPA: hypothetical protein VM052_01535, partial [Candidatus Limnocylindrales bacterium]|nr:hypothetical protein [Candidatus Limnocylindrales bacterium]